jgi:hypothetical protein
MVGQLLALIIGVGGCNRQPPVLVLASPTLSTDERVMVEKEYDQ